MTGRARGITTALVLLVIAAGWRLPSDPLTIAPESKLWIDGKSSVRDWSCKAGTMDAAIDAESNAVSEVLGGSKGVRSVSLVIPVAQIDCNNGTMNGHMRKALNLDKHSTIEFELQSYDLVAGSPVKGTLTGSLTINGEKRPVTIPAEFASGDGGALRMTGTYDLNMTEWKVQPPRLMMGTLKVNEKVSIGFDIVLK